MTHNAALQSPQSHSLLPASDQDDGAPRAGFLARLEAEGAAPGLVRSTHRQRPLVRWLVLVLLAAVAVVAAWLYLSPEPSSPASHTSNNAPRRAAAPGGANKTAVPELPVSAKSLALDALATPDQSSLETFSALAGLNTDIDELAASQASEQLPASMADSWQPTGFASVSAVDADALDDIPSPVIKKRRPARTRSRGPDSDAELLEMLMRRLDQGK